MYAKNLLKKKKLNKKKNNIRYIYKKRNEIK